MLSYWCLCCTAVQVVSSGREMTVVLVSDVSIASRGFRASWDTEPAAQCGGRLEQTAGVIAPPRYFLLVELWLRL